jgi:hypothetical protein
LPARFRLKFAPDSIEAVCRERAVPARHAIEEFAMTTERRPPRQRARPGELVGNPRTENVLPLRSDHAVLPTRASTDRESRDIALLLEDNARLRKLAVQLSNLLGDLPDRNA